MIDKNTTLKELALIVATELDRAGVDAVLVGGIARAQPYSIEKLKSWSRKEGELENLPYSSEGLKTKAPQSVPLPAQRWLQHLF